MVLSATQLAHARTIRDVVQARQLPIRALVIALETGLDESGLLVLANSSNPRSLALPHDGIGYDHASVGIYQQQPGDAPGSTVNWGTTHDCMDPALSTGKFLTALARHPWESMSNWAAAQAVQVSIYSDGSNYRRYDQQAAALAAQLWGETMPLSDDDIRRIWTWDLANGAPVAQAYEVVMALKPQITELRGQVEALAVLVRQAIPVQPPKA